jgi:hypothetical protein
VISARRRRRVGREPRQRAPRLVANVDREPAEVALDVGVVLAGAEPHRALAAQLDDLVREHADVQLANA